MTASPDRHSVEPFPDLTSETGPIGMRELQAARALLAQGLELSRQGTRRIVDHAIELTVRSMPIRHEEECAWWRGAGCDHECRRGA